MLWPFEKSPGYKNPNARHFCIVGLLAFAVFHICGTALGLLKCSAFSWIQVRLACPSVHDLCGRCLVPMYLLVLRNLLWDPRARSARRSPLCNNVHHTPEGALTDNCGETDWQQRNEHLRDSEGTSLRCCFMFTDLTWSCPSLRGEKRASGYCWLTLQFPSFLAVFYSDHRSFYAHAPRSFYVTQLEGTSLLGKGKVYMNISVSAWTLNAKVIYIWLHSLG